MPRWLPQIDPGRCTGCGRCVATCPPHVLVLERRGWEKVSALADTQACTGCRRCMPVCPFGAISGPGPASKPEPPLLCSKA